MQSVRLEGHSLSSSAAMRAADSGMFSSVGETVFLLHLLGGGNFTHQKSNFLDSKSPQPEAEGVACRFVALGCGGGGEAGGGEDAAEVGCGVAVEECGVGLFGQELELGCVVPVIGVGASAVFIGGGEEGEAVDDGVCRGVAGYLCQLREELVEFFRMRGCAGVGKFCLRLEQVVNKRVFRGEEDVLPVPLREFFVEVRQGEFGLFVVAILHAELPCKLACYPFAHQIVSRS